MKIKGEIDGVGTILVLFDDPQCIFRKENFVQIDKTFNFLFFFGGGNSH